MGICGLGFWRRLYTRFWLWLCAHAHTARADVAARVGIAVVALVAVDAGRLAAHPRPGGAVVWLTLIRMLGEHSGPPWTCWLIHHIHNFAASCPIVSGLPGIKSP